MKFGNREFVFVAVLLAVPVSSFWFVFRPQNAEIAQAKREIEHKEKMLGALADATAHTADLAKANEDISRAIELIEARLPTNKEVDVILEQVANIARGNNLELTKVRSDKPVQAAAYMEQPLTMVIRGNFDGFYSFLLDLEQLDRITRMPQLNIERLRETPAMMSPAIPSPKYQSFSVPPRVRNGRIASVGLRDQFR